MDEIEDIDRFDSMVEHKAFLEFLYAFGEHIIEHNFLSQANVYTMSYYTSAKVIFKNEMHVIHKSLQVGPFRFWHQWSCFPLANALGSKVT